MSEKAAELGIIDEIAAPIEVVAEFRRGFHAQMALAKINQDKINAENRRVEARLMDGIGQHVTSIDADVYWAFVHRFGAGCWRDPAFLKSCVEKGTVQRIKGRADKTTVQVQGRRETQPKGIVLCSR